MDINLENRPLISIILPIYDVEPYLQRCIDSILKQTYSQWELLLIDDGSTDGCGTICDSAAEKDSRIMAFHTSNHGSGAARNYGLDHCHGKFITFVDPDDTVDSDYLLYLLGLLEGHGADIASCPVRHIGFSVVDCYSSSGPKAYLGKAAAEYILCGTRGFSGSACHAIFKEDLFVSTRFMGTHFAEDLDIIYRLALKSNSYVVGTVPCYNYFYRDNNSSSKPIGELYKDWNQVISQIYTFTKKQYPELNKAVRTRENSNNIFFLKRLAPNLKKHEEITTDLRKKICSNIPHILFYAECPLIMKVYAVSLLFGKKSFCWAYQMVLSLKKKLNK